MKLPLDICLKGKRSYVHGTDMLNAASAAVISQMGSAGIQHLNFMIGRMTCHNLSVELHQGETRTAATQPLVATLSFEAAGMPWRGDLVEESGEPACRHPYDEDSIIALCRIDPGARGIFLEGEAAFTPIEVIVAMTKALHLALYPEAPGKWVFCRWESERWPVAISSRGVSVVLTKTLGSRLTKSAVICGEERIGWVYFSAKVEP